MALQLRNFKILQPTSTHTSNPFSKSFYFPFQHPLPPYSSSYVTEPRCPCWHSSVHVISERTYCRPASRDQRRRRISQYNPHSIQQGPDRRYLVMSVQPVVDDLDLLAVEQLRAS
ncbi:hypothetical protein N7G274_007274 [Stereocaulon virgatum]|uniref:Uncharacterized protein n=1 Tax=Stereocaulon virgatum TaxID=373712 RepID=A0ABR4A664_9LECA